MSALEYLLSLGLDVKPNPLTDQQAQLSMTGDEIAMLMEQYTQIRMSLLLEKYQKEWIESNNAIHTTTAGGYDKVSLEKTGMAKAYVKILDDLTILSGWIPNGNT